MKIYLWCLTLLLSHYTIITWFGTRYSFNDLNFRTTFYILCKTMLHLIACSIFNIEIALEHNIPEFTLSLSLSLSNQVTPNYKLINQIIYVKINKLWIICALYAIVCVVIECEKMIKKLDCKIISILRWLINKDRTITSVKVWDLIDYAKLRINSKTRQYWRTIRRQLKRCSRGCEDVEDSPTEIESINSCNERSYFIPRSLQL